MNHLLHLVLVALVLTTGCQRGPQPCIFDGTSIGVTPMPMVAIGPDGRLDPESRYSWQDFPWPTDPQLVTVVRSTSEWVFHGSWSGQPWTFRGAFSGPDGMFVRTAQQGRPPDIDIDVKDGRPVLLRYRVKPCREFQGSKTGVRTCTNWGRELNARTKLQCE